MLFHQRSDRTDLILQVYTYIKPVYVHFVDRHVCPYVMYVELRLGGDGRVFMALAVVTLHTVRRNYAVVMKINVGPGNPSPFQESFIYEATSFLYKRPYLY